VCPTGIDIRNGLQYECIACGACVDACNEVMDKVGYPRGLIRFATQNAIEGDSTRVMRPRILVYGTLLAALLFAWGWGITHRSTFIADILRDRNALYRVEADSVENVYTLKLVNKTDTAVEYTLDIVRGPEGAQLRGLSGPITADAAQVLSVPVVVSAPPQTRGRHELVFSVTPAGQDRGAEVKSSFFAPGGP
jgi:polyferredoxin